MLAIRAHYDGKAMIPDEPVTLLRNRPLIIRVENEFERLPDDSFLHPVISHTNRDAARRLIPTQSRPWRTSDPCPWNYLKGCLLTNDAMIVALMRRHGVTHLVTNDNDFDRVPGLTVWKPR